MDKSSVKRIEATKPVLVPTQNNRERAGSGLVPHVEEIETILGSVTGDRVVNVFADDLVAVGENVFLENGSLILDRLFLPIDVIASGGVFVVAGLSVSFNHLALVYG